MLITIDFRLLTQRLGTRP